MADDIYAAAEKQHRKRVLLCALLTVLIVLPLAAWGVLWLVMSRYEKQHELIPGIHCGITEDALREAFAAAYPENPLTQMQYETDGTPFTAAYLPDFSFGEVQMPAVIRFCFRESNARLRAVQVVLLSEQLDAVTADYQDGVFVYADERLDAVMPPVIRSVSALYGESMSADENDYFRVALHGLVTVNIGKGFFSDAQEFAGEVSSEIPQGLAIPENTLQTVFFISYESAHGAAVSDYWDIFREL
jgi:hypothetical protein